MALYEIDPVHSSMEFGVRHMMFTTVKGRFGKVAGQIEFDEAEPTRSSVVATAEVASVSTGEAQRDEHLRSPDFFDAQRFPVITFKSRRIERAQGEGEYKIIGDLTIRDVTLEAVFDAAYLGQAQAPWGDVRAGFSAEALVNRKDFGLQWNVPLESGGFLVGDTVKITLDVEAVRKS